MDLFKKTVRDIKSIKIQGATNVAKSAIKALSFISQKSKAKTRGAFFKDLEKSKKILHQTRATEPLMRNALRFIVYTARAEEVSEVNKLKNIVEIASRGILKIIIYDKKRIAEFSANKIENNMTIFTHCHSSAVSLALKTAKEQGKKFQVICTETRPLYQGRKTAKDMMKYKIPTTMIVDSSVSTEIRKADLVMIGSDMITADVNMMNKIGTLNVAYGARRIGIPFYVCTDLGKYDPETIYGKSGKVEQRAGKEIWAAAPKGLKIHNPAFDITPRNLITSFITQEGIVPPSSMAEIIEDKAPWILKGI